MPSLVKLLMIALLGVLVFLPKLFLPTPFDKMIIVIQALVLALGVLIIGKFGAIWVALVGGLLTALLRDAFAPLSLFFALIYGVSTDLTFYILRVEEHGRVKTIRSVFALSLSAAITGISSMYATVTMSLMPLITSLFVIIIVIGIVNGAVAGYLASIVWNKYLFGYFRETMFLECHDL